VDACANEQQSKERVRTVDDAGCEERDMRVTPLLDRVESLLARGEIESAARRLGGYLASDSRPLGEHGVRLLARLATALGRSDIAFVHLARAGLTPAIDPPRERSSFVVAHGAAWFRVGDADPIALARKPRLRSFLWSLVLHPDGLSPSELFERAWRERAAPVVVRKRIDVSVARLRALGLSKLIVRKEGLVKLGRAPEVVDDGAA
jgi:hypothetical protein